MLEIYLTHHHIENPANGPAMNYTSVTHGRGMEKGYIRGCEGERKLRRLKREWEATAREGKTWKIMHARCDRKENDLFYYFLIMMINHSLIQVS